MYDMQRGSAIENKREGEEERMECGEGVRYVVSTGSCSVAETRIKANAPRAAQEAVMLVEVTPGARVRITALLFLKSVATFPRRC